MEEDPALASPPPSYPAATSELATNPDIQALRTLAVFTYIWSAMCAVFALAGAAYALLGQSMALMDWQPDMTGAGAAGEPFNVGQDLGAPMLIFGIAAMVVMGALAILHFVAARALTRNKLRALILVSAGFAFLNFPFGTVLGVFTFIVMTRPGVKPMFAASRR